MDTWLIDIQFCEEGIVLLMAAHCADISMQIYFALGNKFTLLLIINLILSRLIFMIL